MDRTGEHHVARIDDTVTTANVHERAEAVAVPDFNYVEQTLAAMVIRAAAHHAPAVPGGGHR